MTLQILAFAGSLRAGSLNKKLLGVAVAALAKRQDVEVDVIDLKELAIPLYDGDVEDSVGFPAGVQRLRHRITDVNALLIVSPEYNTSIPGPLKNAIDWCSRPPSPFRGKVAAIAGASSGPVGAARMLPDLRKVLSALHVHVIPQQLGVGRSADAFDGAGNLTHPMHQQTLDQMLDAFVFTARKLA